MQTDYCKKTLLWFPKGGSDPGWSNSEEMVEKTYSDRQPFNGLFFQYNLGKLTPKRLNQSDFNEARDDGLTVTSAGPYANHYLPHCRQITTPAPRQFLRAGCSS